MIVREYHPAFFTGFEKSTLEVHNLKELMNIPFIKNKVRDDHRAFYIDGNHLMHLTWDKKENRLCWWVAAILKNIDSCFNKIISDPDYKDFKEAIEKWDSVKEDCFYKKEEIGEIIWKKIYVDPINTCDNTVGTEQIKNIDNEDKIKVIYFYLEGNWDKYGISSLFLKHLKKLETVYVVDKIKNNQELVDCSKLKELYPDINFIVLKTICEEY